jgi:hypothetical protein
MHTEGLKKTFKKLFSPAFVLVAPDDEVKEGVDEVFRNVIAWTVLGSILVQG